jgi:hypothetical protein
LPSCSAGPPPYPVTSLNAPLTFARVARFGHVQSEAFKTRRRFAVRFEGADPDGALAAYRNADA